MTKQAWNRIWREAINTVPWYDQLYVAHRLAVGPW